METISRIGVPLTDIIPWIWLAFIVLTVVLHVTLAVAVLSDCGRVRRNITVLVGPFIWALGTLLTGLVGAAIYWFSHRSTLNPEVLHRVHHLAADD